MYCILLALQVLVYKIMFSKLRFLPMCVRPRQVTGLDVVTHQQRLALFSDNQLAKHLTEDSSPRYTFGTGFSVGDAYMQSLQTYTGSICLGWCPSDLLLH